MISISIQEIILKKISLYIYTSMKISLSIYTSIYMYILKLTLTLLWSLLPQDNLGSKTSGKA